MIQSKNFITSETRFSWSFLEAYNNCPFKFNRNYNLKEWSPSNIFGLYGCAIHLLFDTLYTENKFIPRYAYYIWESVLQKEYKTKWKQYQYKHLTQKDVDGMVGLGYKHIKAFFAIATREDILKPALFSELGLVGKYKIHPIKAKIDLGTITKYGKTLLDWKSGKEHPHDYYQLILYAAMVEKIRKEKIDAVGVVYLRGDKIKYVRVTPEERAKVGKYIGGIYNRMINDTKFEPKVNEYCKYCNLKGNKCPLKI